MALPGFVTTDAGLPKTRFSGPVLVGHLADNATGGPLYKASGVIPVQSTATIANQSLSTADAVIGRSTFVYIPITPATLAGSAAPPYVGGFTPIVFNTSSNTLQIWSSAATSWMSLVATTSMGIGGFTTSQ